MSSVGEDVEKNLEKGFWEVGVREIPWRDVSGNKRGDLA